MIKMSFQQFTNNFVWSRFKIYYNVHLAEQLLEFEVKPLKKKSTKSYTFKMQFLIFMNKLFKKNIILLNQKT